MNKTIKTTLTVVATLIVLLFAVLLIPEIVKSYYANQKNDNVTVPDNTLYKPTYK